MTTYRNDNGRTGQYPNETILNTSNVNASQFGKRVSYPVDGQVYAQPLYLPNLSIGGSVHNVVFAATENDTVYAFDADQTSAVAPLWQRSLLPSGAAPVSYTAVNCGDLQPIIGITGTPVIDTSTNTMYVVTYDSESGNFVYRLHALDVTTGQDKWAPVVIQGSVPGTGAGSSGGTVTFNASVERQRVGLVLANGKIYIAFSSFCDIGDYHGWIFAYGYNGSFQLANIYNDTPNGIQGGIWGADGALDADSSGNLYYLS
ncbi:MAG: PQQ-binding-like beta-propeller repeat protein, partial [Streptosporangiaceae bacterium]|nr:PQQ-binding-like beta-propeller repeat protein [Streptosporangiaceae bacterium]